MSRSDTEPNPDMVNGPKHYRGDRVMCIIEEFGLGFKDGNVIKYVLRYPEKGGVEDLKKARWYLDRLIAEKEKAAEVKPVDPPEDEFDSLKPGDLISASGSCKYEVLFKRYGLDGPIISIRPAGTDHQGITVSKGVYSWQYRKVALNAEAT